MSTKLTTELTPGDSVAYKGYLITRNQFTVGYFITKNGFRISSPITLAAAKADIDLLTE